MKKRTGFVTAGFVVIVAVVVAGALMGRHGSGPVKNRADQGYVFDRNAPFGAKDARIYSVPDEFKAADAGAYFKNGIINSYTLKYFMFLDDAFKGAGSEAEFFQKVKTFLNTVMPSRDADAFLGEYRRYFRYQQDVGRKMAEWGMPGTPEEAIAVLHSLQDYRREVFGADKADTLFGPSVKMQEYPIRRGMIIEDPSLYGAEKEKKLDLLRQDMWGDGGDVVDAAADPLNRYTEKLRIYSKDLADLKTDEDRQSEIRRFREECFSQEQIQRFDAMDRSVAQETSKEGDYRKGEAAILNDGRLSDSEKSEKISSLQDRLFGSEADAFRRRLVIERGDAARTESGER